MNPARVRGVSLALLLLLALAPAVVSAQSVAYSGKLQIGFGDQDNVTGFRANHAVPICAAGGPLVNPGTVGTTLGTLIFNGVGSGEPGAGGALTFHAVDAAHGGAQQKVRSTCFDATVGFENPRLRSRTQAGSAHFPARKGAYTSMIDEVPVPATPTATYRLSAGGGNTHPVTLTKWTTMGTPFGSTMTFTGSAFQSRPPFFSSFPGFGPLGLERIQPGPMRFGGAIPYSGMGGVQLGIVFTTPMGTPPDYGVWPYVNGFLPGDPRFIGTDAKGIDILSRATTSLYSTSLYTPSVTYTIGLIQGRHDATFAARTPGGSTQHQHGAIRTIAGGNTVSPGPGCPPDCLPIVSRIAMTGAYHAWTTGAVTHVDRVGDFTTIRKASGFDVDVASSTAVAGETRRLQVVSPWGATIRPVGPFGLPIPQLGHGGVAVLTLNVIPAPEPSGAVPLVAGVIGLVVLRERARRQPGAASERDA